jgi:hypothetical protein
MTSHPRPLRAVCALFLAVLVAAPLFAAGKPKQRAVTPPKAEKTTVTGTVTDAVTGAPLKGALVTSNNMSAVTDEGGHYSLTCTLTTEISASRVGYVTVRKPVNATQIDFALPQTPSVTVKLVSGETVVLDYASTKFGYADVFQYVSGDGINLCKAGGEQWSVLKNEFAKITGPAHPATEQACCTRGPMMAIDVTTKDGQKTTAFINDTCFGVVFDVLGIERASTTAKYLHLTDVSEIVFP